LEGSAAGLLLVAAIGVFLPIHERDEADNAPSEGNEIPETALDVQPRSGPVMIRIDYVIAPENVEAFLDLMRQRRRVRSRIGARQWTLSRNLQDPSRWTETFRTATWADYLRLNHRLTTADKQLDERLFQLHAGAPPPSIDLSIERPTAAVRRTVQLRPFIPQP
jgi:hypothetical protein